MGIAITIHFNGPSIDIAITIHFNGPSIDVQPEEPYYDLNEYM